MTATADQLATLRAELTKRAIRPEDYEAIANIARAEHAATTKDQNQVRAHLLRAGKWTLEVAREIGVPVATEALKSLVT